MAILSNKLRIGPKGGFRLKDPSKPHRHNTIPIGKHWYNSERQWVCIQCDQYFDERPDDWEHELDVARNEAIEFERVLGVLDETSTEYRVTWNEHGAWIGCKSIHVIQEEP